ncbi:diguanylate cyclase domain-containing protein [Sulfurimonas sp.]|uniref:diguanylate cyclase domain-containing protein n=1 Tax=Sulfurimonas sp. TaxID=2022749 RepID=UPI003D120174
MELDIRSLSFACTSILATNALVLAIFWIKHKKQTDLGLYALGNLFISISFALVGLRGSIPDFVSLVAGNTIGIAGSFLLIRGSFVVFKLKYNRWFEDIALSLVVVLLIHATYYEPSLKERVLVVSSTIIVQYLYLAFLFLKRSNKEPLSPITITGISFGLVSIYMLFRNTYSVFEDMSMFHDTISAYLHEGNIYAITYIVIMTASTGWTIGILLINYTRIEKERENVILELQKLARTDPLTGLKNRLVIDEIMELATKRAQRVRKEMALLALDLDGFKEVNDTHGHDVGDEVLRQVSKRLSQTLRQTDTVARLGGDEFLVILENLNSKEDVKDIANKLVEIINETYIVKKLSINVTTSIGIAIYEHNNENVQTLLKNADLALYTMKESGKGGYSFYKQYF